MAQGGTYVGLAGGWGSLTNDRTTGTSTSTQVGGFSGRVYLGYLMSVNAASSWMFGPELGYSYYADNTYTVSSSKYKQSGYGVDALLNATYMFSNTLNLAVKPGFQYAFEKMADSTASTSSSDNRILPEVNVGANWQVFADKPFFLGASYQYVWGDDAKGVVTQPQSGDMSVTSRDMFSLNLEYMFH